MRCFIIAIFCLLFVKSVCGQKNKIFIKTEAEYYEMEQEHPKLITLKIINNYENNIEVLNIVNSTDSSNLLKIRTNAKICSKEKHIKFKCEPSASTLSEVKSKWLSDKSMDVNTAIDNGCFPAKGDYKIKLYLFYRVKDSETIMIAYSKWLKVIVN